MGNRIVPRKGLQATIVNDVNWPDRFQPAHIARNVVEQAIDDEVVMLFIKNKERTVS